MLNHKPNQFNQIDIEGREEFPDEELPSSFVGRIIVTNLSETAPRKKSRAILNMNKTDLEYITKALVEVTHKYTDKKFYSPSAMALERDISFSSGVRNGRTDMLKRFDAFATAIGVNEDELYKLFKERMENIIND